MASQNTYTGNGSTTNYSFTFPYLDQNEVVVEVNDTVTTAYTFANATTISLNTAPANGVRIRIYRQTDTANPRATFFPGSAIRAQDLNENQLQSLYSVEEWRDQTVPKYNAVMPDNLSMGTNKITDLGEPTSAQDAATKNYVDTTTVASAGDTMTGPLAMSTNKITGVGDPTNAQDASTKNYTDTQDALRLKRDGTQPMTGSLNFNSNKGINLAEPTNPQDAATKNYVDTTFVDNTTDLIDSTETWVSNDTKIATTAAADARHTMVVNPTIPTVPAGGWQVGKTWLQNDANKTLSYWTGSNWSGIASGGTFTLQPTVIYVDSVNGNDINDGHRIINPKKTIKNAVQSANAGDIIKVAPGVYQEVLPIDITVDNLSIVGDSQRSCFVYPTVATQEQIMFRCNSGTYIDGFTFAGLKASGARGGHAIDNNATYGLPASQGWVAGFYPGCIIKKSPYINNCSNFADASIDNSNFNPNNYAGTGGDLTSAPTGGGIIVDGSLPAVNSPLRSFVVNEFTQVCLDGPGLLVCNNGYAQAVSFFGLFCHYHAKALSGGQINMEVGTTDFGRYGLIADGKSSSAIFTATANGNASAGATTFAINAPTAAGSWFGDVNRPSINMLVQIGSDIYPILSSTANGSGWNVVISRPDPANRAVNLGLINSHSSGATVSFFLRSMISTASHTMEYAGSGTNYNALPENGGVPVEANEVVNLNNGKVWLTSTDQSGKFKVGDTFQVDQQTGFVTIDPNSYSPNIVQDLSPELGGNLDVLTRNIYSSVGNVQINDTLDVTGPILSSSGTAAAPGITFNGDTNTGLYRIGADQLGVATNGVLRFTLSTTGASVAFPVDVPLGTAAAPGYTFTGDLNTGLYSPGADQLSVTTGGTERIRFDSTGQLEAVSLGTAAAPVFTWTTDPDTGLYSSGANTLDVTTGGTAKVRFDSTTAPLKEIYSSVYYPVVTSVDIGSAADQVSLNYMLGDMAFQNAAAINVDQASITQVNNIPLLAGGGLKFPPTQVASGDVNTLDDYEEGTWTPVVEGVTTAGTASYSTQTGSYTKVGRLVHISFYLIWSSGTGTGALKVTGLPFVPGAFGALAISHADNIVLSANNYASANVHTNNNIFIQQIPTGGGAMTNVTYDPAGALLMAGSYSV